MAFSILLSSRSGTTPFLNSAVSLRLVRAFNDIANATEHGDVRAKLLERALARRRRMYRAICQKTS